MALAAARQIAARDPVAALGSAARREGKPQTTAVAGTVLVADVSGFTALTASLQARHGARGADMLSVIMDRLLGALGDIAEAFGGRVTDIIGDAIIAIWAVDETRSAGQAQRAAAKAAEAMLAHAAAASEGEHETPLRIGIASGEIELAMVGGHAGRWELLVLGTALRAAGAACAAAPESACLIASRGWSGDPPDGAEESATGWILHLRDDVEALSPPDAADVLAWDAELRLVTVMFCALVRAEEMALIGVDRVHRLTLVVQEIVARHGGMVDKVHADDKGISMVTAFGMQRGSLPGIPLDQGQGGGSPLHCVLAALDIRRALAELGSPCAIGIATGKVRVGVGDTANGSGYTMYGNAMNLAARCMQASRNEILCDAATRNEALADVDFAEVGDRKMKGLTKVGGLFVATGIRQDRGAPVAQDGGVLAGRVRERALITAFIEDRSPDAPDVMILDGAHGSGKSRMTAFAAEEATRRGHETLLCRATVLGTSTPLFAWRDPMAELLRHRAAARNLTSAQLLADLVAAAGGTEADIPLLASLFGRDTIERDAADAETGIEGANARQLRAAVAAALLGERPRLILFEDAHWLDDTSLLLARDLRKALPQLRLFFAARSPAPDALARGHRNPARVTIGPLDRDETAAFAASLLGPFDPKHPFVDWLQARSAGNPMFCRSLIALLPADIMETALETPGAWRKAQAALERTEMPVTIEGALLARFDNLPPTQLGLLKAASVIGGRFDAKALIALGTPSSPQQIEEDLAALVASGILIANESAGQTEWRFADELTREVICDSLPGQLLRELHKRAAAHAAADKSSDAARIAHHWMQAGLPDRAFAPLRKAGQEAKQAGAYATAVTLWKSALDLLDGGRLGGKRDGKLRRAMLHRDLAFASWRLGEPAQTIEHCYASMEGLWPGAPDSRAGWTMMLGRQIAGLAWQIARPNWLRRKPKREQRLRDWLRLNNGVRLIEAFYFSQGALPAAAMATYSARIAERTGEIAYGARPYGFLGYLAGSHGWDRIARFCFARPRRDCLNKRDWPSLAQSVRGETMYLLTQGEWAEAIARARFGRTLSRKINKGADIGSSMTFIGLAHLMAGDFAAMRAAFEQVEAIAYAKANDHYLTFAREAFGQIELVAGSPQRAEGLLVGAFGLAKGVRDLQSALIAEGLLANTLVVLGRLDEAASMMPGLLERAETTPMVNFGTWYGFGAVAEAATGLYAARGAGEADINRLAAVRAVTLLSRFARNYPVAVPRARLVSGQLDALNGNPAAAIKGWARGIRAAEAVAMRHDLARLHDAMARIPGTAEADARHHAQRAAALARQCGVDTLPPLPLQPATLQGTDA